jgi:hypothetical protein
MRNAFILAAALSLSAAFVPCDASAFSAPPANSAYQSDAIIRVEGGCGPGFHRNPYGYCRPNGPGPGWGAPGPVVVPVPVPGYGYGAYYGRRCWMRPTPWGPRRVCN